MSDTSESSEFDDAVSAYLKFKEAESGKATYIRDVRQRLTNIGGKCGFRLMADITHERLSAWFMEISELDPKTRRSKLAPVTRINYRKTFSGFMTWCIRMGRMNGPNPVEKLPQPRIKGDFRRPRRAMTHEELLRVLKVALIKPMAEYARRRVSRTVNTKESWAECEVTADNIDVYANEAAGLLWQQPHYLKKLQRDGRQRELIYRTFASTGLRKGELRDLAVKQIVFEEKTKTARIELDPRFEKNGDGSTLHLTAELAVDLKQWIEDEKLEGDNLLFSVPQQIVKTFHRDCIVAGVDRKDARGKQIDIHALRYTFCTLLSQIGVAPRLAQSAMRHKDINLTMTLYTDARNLDVAKAVGTLPSMFCPMAENTVQLSDASKAMVGGLSSMEMMLVKLFRMADAEKQEAIISSLV